MSLPTRDPRGPAPILHLASRSPRRRRLLEERAIPHEAEESGVDDSTLEAGGATPEQWVAALAYLKARAASDRLERSARSNRLALGADTLVVKCGRLIGQPHDADDAGSIIRALQNGEHDVITGVALIDTASKRRTLFVDRARVRVGAIGDDRIASYIASGLWRGKAGAYNLSERLAEGWPIDYQGDPGTIMGLPMVRLVPILARWGVVPAPSPLEQAR